NADHHGVVLQKGTALDDGLFEVLRLDGENPEAAAGQLLVGCTRYRGALGGPALEDGLVGIYDMHVVRAAAFSDQAGGQGRGHVAAANEGDSEFFGHDWAIVAPGISLTKEYPSRYSHASAINA